MSNIIHFIWIGPNPFPKEPIDNIHSSSANHSDWIFKFWTDRRCPLPSKKMELQFIANFPFDMLKYCDEESSNYTEKADLLCYELVF